MQISSFCVHLLIVASITVEAMKCGMWYSNDCLGKSDKRYDDTASNHLIDQDDVWKNLDGYWTADIYQYDELGLPQKPVPSPFGYPYKVFPFKAYQNITISGSRYIWNGIAVYPPVDNDSDSDVEGGGFCDIPFDDEPFADNVMGEQGQCGVTGYMEMVDQYGVSSYEKDGSMYIIGTRNIDVLGTDIEFEVGDSSIKVSPVENALYFFAQYAEDWGYGMQSFFWTSIYVFLNDIDLSITDASFELKANSTRGLPVTSIQRWTKISEEEWVEGIGRAVQEYNVTEEEQFDFAYPVEGCYSPPCPEETDWCEFDPNCSQSPYQEPDSSLKVQVIVGIILVGVLILSIVAFIYHKKRLARQEQKTKQKFVERVAQKIRIDKSASQLNPDDLRASFLVINNGLPAGNITRDKLWAYLSTGSAGDLPESDFNRLFDAMDLDGNGYIDFLEFCAYLSNCKQELDNARKHGRRLSAEERLDMCATRLSNVSTSAAKRVAADVERHPSAYLSP